MAKAKKTKKATKDPKKADKKQAKAAKKAEKKVAKQVAKTPPYKIIAPSLTATDVEASYRFYTTLGFTPVETWKSPEGVIRGYELKAGKISLMIGQDDFAKGRERKKGEGLRFYFQTKEKVDDVAARLTDAGFALESEPKDMEWGSRAFSVVDPDGFNVTVTTPW
jgi:uncharacterized glyoxalase superfamily protein PhnB